MSSRPGPSINPDQEHGASARPSAAPNLTSGSSAHLTVLILAWAVSDDDLSDQLSIIAEWRRSRPNLRPVFVTDSSTVDGVAGHGLDIERIDGETAAPHVAHPSTGSLDTRLQEIMDKYRPHLVVAAGTASLQSAISAGALDAVLHASPPNTPVETIDDYQREIQRLKAARSREKRKKRRAREDAARLARKLVTLEEKLSATEGPGLLPATSGAAPLEANEGEQFLGPLTEGCTTTLVLAWGLTNDAFERLVQEIGRAQTMLRDFKPLFVTDSWQVDALRRSGYSFELIPSFTVWSRSNPSHEWVEFITCRMDRILQDYRPYRVVTFDGTQSFDAIRMGVMNRLLAGGGPHLERGAAKPPPDRSQHSTT